MFALSNGYFGVRGTFDEGMPAHSPGVFVSGFHEQWPILHAEAAYGLARTGQTIVNVPDATMLRLYVDDEPLFVATARMREYSRILDMRAGTLTRELVWETAAGKRVRGALLPDRVARAPASDGGHLRGRAARALGADRDLVDDPQPPGRASAPRARAWPSADPRHATSLPHRVLNAEVVSSAGRSDAARVSDDQQSHDARRRRRPRDREHRRTASWASALDGDIGEAVLTADATARRADPDHQVHHLPVLTLGCLARAGGAVRADARSRDPRRTGGAAGLPARGA